MVSEAEQVLLRAVSNHTDAPFRNLQLVEATDLSKQHVNHFLNKWIKGGYVERNPLKSGQYFLTDLPGLIESCMNGAEENSLKHAKCVDPFDPDKLEIIQAHVDTLVALRATGIPAAALRKYKDEVEGYLTSALRELRAELHYVRAKKVGIQRAKRFIKAEVVDVSNWVDRALIEEYTKDED